MQIRFIVAIPILIVCVSQASAQNSKATSELSSKEGKWLLSKEGFKMIVIKQPKVFMMGSPRDELYHSEDELQHQVFIPRNYAIASKEVTQEQFQKFLSENPKLNKKWKEEVSEHFKFRGISQFVSDPKNPQAAVSWYDAVSFCNWLSKKEGIPHQEWCYPDTIGPGMVLPKDLLNRKGYRLPTEAEWEYATRAGTTTSHFFGTSDKKLTDYAWYRYNTNSKKTRPVGSLKPNQFGLFDVYGNVWEWCQDRRLSYHQTNSITNDVQDTEVIVLDSMPRIRRGGSFTYDAETTRSAHRGATNYFPNQRRDGVGFRVVKTIDK